MTVSISTVIPVFDGERYLGEALESVFAQTLPPDEVIVVDDGSTDNSSAIARSFERVRCIRQARAGQAAALNAGVAASHGHLLAFLDADDRWLPDKLASQAATLFERPDVDLVFGHSRLFTEPTLAAPRAIDGRILPARLPSALLVRRSVWQHIGPFSTEWTVGGVVEWCLRAESLALKTVVLDAVVYERRIHRASPSMPWSSVTREYARMLKTVLDRRRATARPRTTENAG